MSECMHRPPGPKNVAVVERWSSVEARLYSENILSRS